jgi:heat shock protein HslJ
MVRDVTLTALGAGVAYSGQSLAITEFAQASQAANWWPPTVSVAGMIGDGSFSQKGTVSGKVTGEVAKKGSGLNHSSDPVLLWEQAGTRFVIYLEHEK